MKVGHYSRPGIDRRKVRVRVDCNREVVRRRKVWEVEDRSYMRGLTEKALMWEQTRVERIWSRRSYLPT